MSIELIIGVAFVVVGIAMAFAKVDPDEIKRFKYFFPLISLHRYPWWHYGISFLMIVFGLLLLFSYGELI